MPSMIVPQLKEPTQQLIAQIYEVHQAHAGDITLDQFLGLLPDSIDPEGIERLKSRKLSFESVDEYSGRFSSIGKKLEISASGTTIKIPQQIGGTYISHKSDALLSFDDQDGSSRIKACKFIFCISLLRLIATQSSVTIDLDGDDHDYLITFAQ